MAHSMNSFRGDAAGALPSRRLSFSEQARVSPSRVSNWDAKFPMHVLPVSAVLALERLPTHEAILDQLY